MSNCQKDKKLKVTTVMWVQTVIYYVQFGLSHTFAISIFVAIPMYFVVLCGGFWLIYLSVDGY